MVNSLVETRAVEALASPATDDRPADRKAPHHGTPPSRSGRILATWGWEIALIVALAGALPLLAAARLHSLGKPMFDDWSYLNSLAHLAQHGTVNLNHWASIFEVGQLLLACPLYLLFGVHPVLADLWVLVLGMVGLLGVVYLGRRCGLPRGLVLLLLTTLIVCPLYFQVSTTFMTDVPCFTFMVLALCLWIGCKDPSRFDARRWTALGLATIAFTIREPAAVVALPILYEPIISAHRRRDRRSRNRTLLLAAAWVVLLGAMWEWREGLPSGSAVTASSATLAPLFRPWVNGWLPAMLGLFLIPILLASSPRALISGVARHHRRLTAAIVFGCFLVPLMGIAALAASQPIEVQLGNVISIDGFLPLWLRLGLSLLGLAALTAGVLVFVAYHQGRQRIAAADRRSLNGLITVTLVYAAVLLAGTVTGLVTSDRYWLIVIALSALVIGKVGTELRPPAPVAPAAKKTAWRPVMVGASLLALLFYGAAIYADTGAERAGLFNFADQAVSHLPTGDGPEDLDVSWVWDGGVYTADPSITPVLVQPGVYRFSASDGSGSTFTINSNTGGAVTCAPFAVRQTTDVTATHPQALWTSPISHGLLVSYRFYLVRQALSPASGCH
ncbi:MAG TPA: hypothetical protein VGF87_05240 [Acidimicrobiales bacterium]